MGLNTVEKRIILDLDVPIHAGAVYLHAGDTAAKITARFMRHGEVYHIADGTAAKIRFNGATAACEIDGDAVHADVTSEMTEKQATLLAQFVLTGADASVLVTPRFTVIVSE